VGGKVGVRDRLVHTMLTLTSQLQGLIKLADGVHLSCMSMLLAMNVDYKVVREGSTLCASRPTLLDAKQVDASCVLINISTQQLHHWSAHVGTTLLVNVYDVPAEDQGVMYRVSHTMLGQEGCTCNSDCQLNCCMWAPLLCSVPLPSNQT
jgi:hypothetical protein